MITQTQKIIAFLAFVILVPMGVATATEGTRPAREGMQKRPEATIEKRCEMLQGNIEKRLEEYNNKKDTHKTAYARFISKVEEIIEKLDARGKDTTQIKIELEERKE